MYSTMDAVQTAWLAGLYEGEGTLVDSLAAGSVRLAIAMTDLDIITRCREVTGVGYVRIKSTARRVGGKPCHIWEVYRGDHVAEILTAIRPHLGERRGIRVDRALARLSPGDRRRLRVATCGTTSGYRRHHRGGETPCGPCQTALREYARQLRARKRASDVVA